VICIKNRSFFIAEIFYILRTEYAIEYIMSNRGQYSTSKRELG